MAPYPRGEGAGVQIGLAAHLDRLAAAYGANRLGNDPVSLVRRYDRPGDREVAGLVVSSLAFGNVRSILRSAAAVLALLGPSPARAVRERDFAPGLRGFRHRWVAGPDVARLLRAVGRALDEYGRLEDLFLAGLAPDADDPGAALDAFSRRLKTLGGGRRSRGFDYLLPEPGRGGAAKRPSLYLRWMARPDDGVDLGAWSGLDPAKLVIPLDTHVLRIARYVGLTSRRTATWATALDVTRALRKLDPADPVRFDFAIAQLGISRGCLHRRVPDRCGVCPLDAVCTL